ncbi:MAG: hypothetical protein LBF51_03085 [Zoogloeaceae bacterium]|jgi:hypothetical protein|nr:hypothetical protein [Zoogloeaceae bacterium]
MTIFSSGLQNAAGAGRFAPLLAPTRYITASAAPTLTQTASTQVNISLYGRTMVLTRISGAAHSVIEPLLAEAPGNARAADAEAVSSGASTQTPLAQEVLSAAIALAQLKRQGWDGSMSPEAFLQRQEAIARGEDPDGGRFGKYQVRLDPYMTTFFSTNDKKIIGEAYEMAVEEGDLARIDKLVMELGALRIRQRLNGELIRSVRMKKVNPDDVPYEPDVAHLPLLGEMKRLAAKAR